MTVTQGASPSVTLTHDPNGNLTGEGTWAFAYDAENRLRTATRAGTAASYLYDPLGRRQAKIVNGVTTSFLSDGAEEVAEYTGTGVLLRRYIPGPGTDQPIAMVTPAGAIHTRSYFHVNRQGSTVAMSNDAGTVSEGPYTYDAYGQGASSAGVPFKYTGRRLDPETGLYYYRARYYSASLGRFLQTDPIGYGDDMNLYAYVGGDPVNATDPSGMSGRLIKAAAKIAKRAYENGGDLKKAGADELVDLAENIGTLVDGKLDWNDAVAVVDLATGLGEEAKVAGRVVGEVVESASDATNAARGGTYKLIDSQTGQVRRTGQTNDLERRRSEHARGDTTKDLDFEVDKLTDDRSARRGREQIIHDQHPEADLNRRNPISPKKPRRDRYMKAGRRL